VSLYVAEGDGYRAGGLTRGPWDPGFQHAGPPAALLAREAERASGLAGGQFARLTFDILRPVPIALVTVRARVLRPGRRVEQVEAVLESGGEALMRLTAWRMRREAVELPAGLPAVEPPPPGPEGLPRAEMPFFGGQEGYRDALDWGLASGSVTEPGPAAVWTSLRVPLVEGEAPTPLQRLLVMADAASGVSATLDWTAYTFLNVDFSVHLEREPEGEWIAMDARTRPGPSGMGQCTSVLSDTRGRVGMSTQSLLVTRRDPRA
jgi:hypothetical protein